MKKLLLLVLALAMLLCFTACGGDDPVETGGSTDASESTAATDDGKQTEGTQTEAEDTFSPDLNLTEIDRFD